MQLRSSRRFAAIAAARLSADRFAPPALSQSSERDSASPCSSRFETQRFALFLSTTAPANQVIDREPEEPET
jgi:hypothetical protein